MASSRAFLRMALAKQRAHLSHTIGPVYRLPRIACPRASGGYFPDPCEVAVLEFITVDEPSDVIPALS